MPCSNISRGKDARRLLLATTAPARELRAARIPHSSRTLLPTFAPDLGPSALRRVVGTARYILDEADAERGPAGLVRGTEAAAGVAVEVLVEEHEVAPARVGGEARVAAVAGAGAVGSGQEQA